ncbi:unnamed protein product [Lathyrus oleraceus]
MVANEVTYGVVHPDVVVVDPTVQSDVAVADSVSSATTDTEIPTYSIEPSVHTDGGFLGGPIDRSVMIEYVDHVAYRLWQGDDRLPQKVTSHGSKLKGFLKTLMHEEVIRILRDFELLDFSRCSLTKLDAPVLTTFVKRWHKETSSFHLSFMEMTITLDDISLLFHLPFVSRLWTDHVISLSLACLIVA